LRLRYTIVHHVAPNRAARQRIPGERAYRARARLAREGIEIDLRIHDALIKLTECTSGA
jgi:LDH2 family malate/lactate/ureidoglycolate dehydrogenase